MVVALDATPLTVATGGIRRYVEQLHRALTTAFPEDRYLLLDASTATGLDRRWWSWGLPRTLQRDGAQLFHGTDFAVPYRRVVPAVITLHDLSPWLYPDETSPRVRRRTPWLLKLGRADRIVTPSEAIRRAAIERFALEPARVHAVPLGVGEEFRPTPTLPPPQRPYFLAVGTLEGRKNLRTAVAAHQTIADQADLLIAGRPGSGGDVIGRHVRQLGAVPDHDLPALYRQAAALLMPSLYEGFGLPVLEAMACGTPVIASRDPALLETAGGAALHVDAEDVRGWTSAMQAVLANRAQYSDAGRQRAAQFPWSRTAQLTREVYLDALGRH